jgi:predicted dehydrogenase
MTATMRAAIVGMCGWAGTRHLDGYRDLGIPVTHFVDAAPDAEAHARRLGIERLSSVEALGAADVDIVSVALPPSMQPEVCRTLLAAGKSVLCEKPMGPTRAEAAELAGLASDALLMPAYLLRFHPVYRRMKALIESGEFGGLQEVAIDSRVLKRDVGGWRRDAGSGGAMLVNGIHAVDLAHWLCQSDLEVRAAQADTRFFAAPVSDCVRAWLSTPAGAHVSLRAQWWPFEERDPDSEYQEGWTMRVRAELDDAVLIQTFSGLRIVRRDASGAFEVMETPNLFAEEIRHFAQCVDTRTLPCVTVADNARAQATVERILEIAGKGAASRGVDA